MKNQFNILHTSRKILLKAIEELTIEQLHTIPKGYKNNIVWNVVHLMVTQQLLHYKLSDLDCLVPDDMINEHKKGTSPTMTFTASEFEDVKELFLGLPATLEEDYETGIFEKYNEYKTSTGFVIDSIDAAINFNNFHEGIHLGIILGLKKIV